MKGNFVCFIVLVLLLVYRSPTLTLALFTSSTSWSQRVNDSSLVFQYVFPDAQTRVAPTSFGEDSGRGFTGNMSVTSNGSLLNTAAGIRSGSTPVTGQSLYQAMHASSPLSFTIELWLIPDPYSWTQPINKVVDIFGWFDSSLDSNLLTFPGIEISYCTQLAVDDNEANTGGPCSVDTGLNFYGSYFANSTQMGAESSGFDFYGDSTSPGLLHLFMQFSNNDNTQNWGSNSICGVAYGCTITSAPGATWHWSGYSSHVETSIFGDMSLPFTANRSLQYAPAPISGVTASVPFQGTLMLAAMYNRSLTMQEMVNNHNAYIPLSRPYGSNVTWTASASGTTVFSSQPLPCYSVDALYATSWWSLFNPSTYPGACLLENTTSDCIGDSECLYNTACSSSVYILPNASYTYTLKTLPSTGWLSLFSNGSSLITTTPFTFSGFVPLYYFASAPSWLTQPITSYFSFNCTDGVRASTSDGYVNLFINLSSHAVGYPYQAPYTVTVFQGIASNVTLNLSSPNPGTNSSVFVYQVTQLPTAGTLSLPNGTVISSVPFYIGNQSILVYQSPASVFPANYTLVYQGSDGYAGSNQITLTMNVSHVYQPPVPQNFTLNLEPGSVGQIFLNATDPDTVCCGDSIGNYTITSLGTALTFGVLSFVNASSPCSNNSNTGHLVTTAPFGSNGSTMCLSYNVTALENATVTASISYQVCDATKGMCSSNPGVITLNILPAILPTWLNITISENSNYTLSLSSLFGLFGALSSSPSSVWIDFFVLPVNGSFYFMNGTRLSSLPVSLNVSAIQSLIYVPARYGFGSPFDSFQYRFRASAFGIVSTNASSIINVLFVHQPLILSAPSLNLVSYLTINYAVVPLDITLTQNDPVYVDSEPYTLDLTIPDLMNAALDPNLFNQLDVSVGGLSSSGYLDSLLRSTGSRTVVASILKNISVVSCALFGGHSTTYQGAAAETGLNLTVFVSDNFPGATTSVTLVFDFTCVTPPNLGSDSALNSSNDTSYIIGVYLTASFFGLGAVFLFIATLDRALCCDHKPNTTTKEERKPLTNGRKINRRSR
jgi:hypothetical protein